MPEAVLAWSRFPVCPRACSACSEFGAWVLLSCLEMTTPWLDRSALHFSSLRVAASVVTHEHRRCRLLVARECRGVVPVKKAAAPSKCSRSVPLQLCRHRPRRLSPGSSPCLAALLGLSLMNINEPPWKGTAPLISAARPRAPRWPCRRRLLCR